MALDSKWRKRLMVLGMIALVGGGALGLFAWYKFFREVDEPTFASLEERYKYGSIGAESKAGLPYWIWVALPRVFPDYVPGVAAIVHLVWPGKKVMRCQSASRRRRSASPSSQQLRDLPYNVLQTYA